MILCLFEFEILAGPATLNSHLLPHSNGLLKLSNTMALFRTNHNIDPLVNGTYHWSME
jgi:hypothetical protein